eukprot:Pgem_evm1s19936
MFTNRGAFKYYVMLISVKYTFKRPLDVNFRLVEGSAFRTFTHFNDEAQLKLQGSYSQNDLPGCDTYHLNQCQGNVIETDPSFESYRWYTPAKGEKGYLPSFQDYSV